MLKCDNGSTETEVRKWTKTEVRKPKYENEKKSRLLVSKLSSTLCSENMPFSNSTKCSLLCYLSLPIIPYCALKKSNYSIIVMKHERHALQYCLQEHVVVVDLKTQRSQLVSSQSSVAAIFWFFYTCFGFKGHLSHDSK